MAECTIVEKQTNYRLEKQAYGEKLSAKESR